MNHATATVYEQHDAAFRHVSAFCIVGKDAKGEPERKATIAFKFGVGGTVFCYLHVFGGPMVRGRVMHAGNDKAAAHAASKIDLDAYHPDERHGVETIRDALLQNRWPRWDYALHNTGFHVFSAV